MGDFSMTCSISGLGISAPRSLDSGGCTSPRTSSRSLECRKNSACPKPGAVTAAGTASRSSWRRTQTDDRD